MALLSLGSKISREVGLALNLHQCGLPPTRNGHQCESVQERVFSPKWSFFSNRLRARLVKPNGKRQGEVDIRVRSTESRGI